jgi:hypothetical protein
VVTPSLHTWLIVAPKVTDVPEGTFVNWVWLPVHRPDTEDVRQTCVTRDVLVSEAMLTVLAGVALTPPCQELPFEQRNLRTSSYVEGVSPVAEPLMDAGSVSSMGVSASPPLVMEW